MKMYPTSINKKDTLNNNSNRYEGKDRKKELQMIGCTLWRAQQIGSQNLFITNTFFRMK